MESVDIQNILVAILTSIITGGFILVFVEIGNRKNRENDRYGQIMSPFIHKLSAYFRFISWCSGHIRYPKSMNGYEMDFKKLVKRVGDYGGKTIISGGDYDTRHFSANELEEICLDINNIWYYHDKMNPCNLIWEDYSLGETDFIAKELKDIFPQYLASPKNVKLVSKVSGEFYSDIYQPIKYETYRHEAYIRLFKWQTIIVSVAVALVLITLLLMLFIILPVWAMRLAGVMTVLLLALSLMLLAVDMNRQVKFMNQMIDKLRETNKRIRK